MRPALFVFLLLFVAFIAAPARADLPLAVVSPPITFSINLAPPFACEPNWRGTIALNSATQLCICNGEQWVLANTNKACEWSAPAK